MGRLYIVRHGEAAGDEAEDPGLSERGREQSRALAQRLGRHAIAEIWHGPRRRTTETARILGEGLGGAPTCRPTDLLDDRTPVPSAARHEDYPAHRWPWFARVPPQERDEDGRALTRSWGEVSRMGRAGSVVVVTHAFVAGWFVRELLGAPAAAWTRLAVANAGLTVVSWDDVGDPQLEVVNDTCHLEDGGPGGNDGATGAG